MLFDRNVLTIINGKGGKDRLIPMTRRLAQALADWFLVDGFEKDDYLWACRPGGHDLRRTVKVGPTSLKTWYSTALRDAGVPYRKFHSTRHTFATRCLRRGISLTTVSRLMGHSSIKTTADEYAHLAVEDLAAELAFLEIS